MSTFGWRMYTLFVATHHTDVVNPNKEAAYKVEQTAFIKDEC